ncbi:hypothetical protein VNI00_010231 [Paramarasmius palmivorus]|uniref:Uncharacterized protein n=1 Tax=Paramarasmius palmivorus TaxID=297713 RepID=A0AAW0CL24_9AGAR
MLNRTTDLMRKTFAVSGTTNNEAWVRGWELRQFGVNYRGSPITVDERYTDISESVDPYRSGQDGSAHGGDRASDAPGLVSDGEKKRLFDLLSPLAPRTIWTPWIALKAWLPQRSYTLRERFRQTASADYTFVDGDCFAYKHYNVKAGETLAVGIRPDCYIGAVAKDGLGVRKYFDRILAYSHPVSTSNL